MYKLVFTKHSSKHGMNYSFYVIDKWDNRWDLDTLVGRYGVDKTYYFEYLRDNFNSDISRDYWFGRNIYYGRPFFKNKKDCKKAMEWTEGLMVIQTLMGEEL